MPRDLLRAFAAAAIILMPPPVPIILMLSIWKLMLWRLFASAKKFLLCALNMFLMARMAMRTRIGMKHYIIRLSGFWMRSARLVTDDGFSQGHDYFRACCSGGFCGRHVCAQI